MCGVSVEWTQLLVLCGGDKRRGLKISQLSFHEIPDPDNHPTAENGLLVLSIMTRGGFKRNALGAEAPSLGCLDVSPKASIKRV